ncbi:uncharacterized protein BT62DRAFT_925114 [Guyanagaster necrorhizus]|uniref:Uncharacterized protein n=1 Tax=Guyanagaster necrorhizus TaxID=856835 RepID=A0A9P7W4R1_9AGAR|nr:uncharacterized protein BT62DRAFT_925114 [Guyanagaster necrorhizus MCA 3950]KAG7452559.1 hypothetical protein BT62DRAFT_925114 [Guyanagaster necrorhizus MCA 3950]
MPPSIPSVIVFILLRPPLTLRSRVHPVKPGGHVHPALWETFQASLKALNRQEVRVLYLHAPNRKIPFEDTL